MTDAIGNTTSFSYDALNRMITRTDPSGNTTKYAYNNMDLVETETDPLGGVKTYEYDKNGNIIKKPVCTMVLM